MRLVLFQRAVLRAPSIERLLRNTELLTHPGDRRALSLKLLGLSKLRHDLFGRITLTRHQHPYRRSQDSRHSHTNWTNPRGYGQAQYRQIPVEITDRTLSDEERLRAWIYIHRQRKEWDAKEKEMVAYRLVDLVGRASAANILGVSVRELEKLVQVFELSERFDNLREAGAAITWARELNGVSKTLLTPSVTDAVVEKVGRRQITNSKDLRKLRVILRDPVAKAHFLDPAGDIDSALLRIAAPGPTDSSLRSQLERTTDAVRQMPWTEVQNLRGDEALLKAIDETTNLLAELRKSLQHG